MSGEKQRLVQHLKISEAEARAFSLEIQKFVERALRQILKEKRLGTLNAPEAAQAIASVFEDLRQRGLEAEASKLSALYKKEVRFIEKELLKVASYIPEGGIFSDIDKNTIDAIVNVEEQKVLMNIGASVSEIQAALMRTAIAGQPLNIESLLVERMDALSTRLETLANTGLAGFQRTVILAKAQDLGFNLFIYLGPDDKATRPFCERLLNVDPPIFSIQEINQMDNGQGLPVMQYGGGYNCRHQWRPISADDARARGWRAARG